jgi:hypothetical protein
LGLKILPNASILIPTIAILTSKFKREIAKVKLLRRIQFQKAQ